jgi:hypothetical protein
LIGFLFVTYFSSCWYQQTNKCPSAELLKAPWQAPEPACFECFETGGFETLLSVLSIPFLNHIKRIISQKHGKASNYINS